MARDPDPKDVQALGRATTDFALVVGVDHYPKFRSLSGAVTDAHRMYEWLVDPAGGAVRPEYARLVVSRPEPAAPLQDEIDEQLVELLEAARSMGGGRRFYFHFSGHGAASAASGEDVALLLAKWSRTMSRLALSTDSYRTVLCGAGLFEELAIFLDCCRVTTAGAIGMPPLFELQRAPAWRATRTFLAYATEGGSSAYEITEEQGWRGVFTARLLSLLRASTDGLYASELKHALERTLSKGRQTAHVINGLGGDSRFGGPLTPALDPGVSYAWASSRRSGRTTSREAEEPMVGRCNATSAELLVSVQRMGHKKATRYSLSDETFSVHDAAGRLLARVDQYTDEANCSTLALQVSPGTYRLRGAHTRRDVAITVPAGRVARIFCVDRGARVMADLRVHLVPIEHVSNCSHQRLLESVLRTLFVPWPFLKDGFSSEFRELPRKILLEDLCLAIAVAHLAIRCHEYYELHRIAGLLAPYQEIPDIALLLRAAGFGWSTGQRPLEPPLFLASLQLALAEPIPSTDGFALAAATVLHDSVWCTWSARPWDMHWIAATIGDAHSRKDGEDTHALAKRVSLPVPLVKQVLVELETTASLVDDLSTPISRLSVPGYVIHEVLSRGKLSVVFRAARVGDSKDIALKVIPPMRDSHQQMCDGSMYSIAHPRVLGIRRHGLLQQGAGMWVEMELCRESLLDVMLKRDTPLSVERARSYVLEALEGLSYLHSCGFVHGNVKPGNLLVGRNGRVVIGDLVSAACMLDAPKLDASGVMRGVSRFLPPEQLVGDKGVLPASDVWGMAATLYFLLTLELPREEYAGQSDLEAAMANPIVPIRDRRPGLPARIARCIDGALSIEVAARPRDGASFLSGLRAAL